MMNGERNFGGGSPFYEKIGYGKGIQELYVDFFFENRGIGGKLPDFACQKGGRYLWVLEKNESAIRFYEKHHFRLTGEKQPEEGTEEYIVKMGYEKEEKGYCSPVCQ